MGLDVLTDDGKRYEIIDGELWVSKQPHWYHQLVCGRLSIHLQLWSNQSHAGITNLAPGVILDDDEVAPDVIWISNSRLETALESDGKLHMLPELVIEVLSPGPINTRRDRYAKLKLYSGRSVSEYWIVDWVKRRVEIYGRDDVSGRALRLVELNLTQTLDEADILRSALFPGLSIPVADLFAGIPADLDPTPN